MIQATPPAANGILHYVPQPGEEDSLAALVDDARTLLVDAVGDDVGPAPDVLIVGSRLYDVVASAKAKEAQAGRPLTVLGMRLLAAGSAHSE